MSIYVGLSVPDFLSNFQEVANRLDLRLLGKNILSAPLSFARTLSYPEGGGSRERQPPGPLLSPINRHRIRSAETLEPTSADSYILLP